MPGFLMSARGRGPGHVFALPKFAHVTSAVERSSKGMSSSSTVGNE
jgi:hypothetical protein